MDRAPAWLDRSGSYGRSDFVNIQARYPTNTGHKSFKVHRLVANGDVVVSEVTVAREVASP